MKHTNVRLNDEDLTKLKRLVSRGWQPGETMIIFSVGEGIRRDKKTNDAVIMCHQLALDYGLPEIAGYYGIANDGEFLET